VGNIKKTDTITGDVCVILYKSQSDCVCFGFKGWDDEMGSTGKMMDLKMWVNDQRMKNIGVYFLYVFV